MTRSTHLEPWQQLADCLAHDEPPLAVKRVLPPSSNWLSFLDSLSTQSVASSLTQAQAGCRQKEALETILSRLRRFESLRRCPIVAISGQLNSGKSSLLATYLSPQSRCRVPRGLDNASGTHRFVLWLPSKWADDDELLHNLKESLLELFGAPPEMLDEVPGRAAQQYTCEASVVGSEAGTAASRDTNRIATPLIAFDDSLNELQLGLVDCPDIQSGFGTLDAGDQPEEYANQRTAYLSVMAKLCSAFVVVCNMRSLHDESMHQILASLRDAMPGVPRLLAVNRVKARYAPETVLEQSQPLVDRYALADVYVAYDFRSSLAYTRIPPPPSRLIVEAKEQLPIFFSAIQPPENSPRSQSPQKYLIDIGLELDVGFLARESSRSLTLQLATKATQAQQWFQQNQEAKLRQLQDIWVTIAHACFDFMANRDAQGGIVNLRMQASPTIVSQLSDSLGRTAPAWMKASVMIDRTARQFQQAVRDSAGRLRLLGGVSNSVKKLVQRFRRGDGAQVLTPQRLANAIRQEDHVSAVEFLADDVLSTQCDLAMTRFSKEDETRLDQSQVDQWSRDVWKNMSWRQKLWKGTQPLAMIAAPFLAVILIPVDAGGTAVLVFASTKELLAAAGLATLLGPTATGRETLELAQRETAWLQLSNLFAVSCDSLGIPRPALERMPELNDGAGRRLILPSTIPVATANIPGAPAVWQTSQEFGEALANAVGGIR